MGIKLLLLTICLNLQRRTILKVQQNYIHCGQIQKTKIAIFIQKINIIAICSPNFVQIEGKVEMVFDSQGASQVSR